jgi:hypothetical protein
LLNVEFWSEVHLLDVEQEIFDDKLSNLIPSQYKHHSFYLNHATIPVLQINRNIIQPYLKEKTDK